MSDTKEVTIPHSMCVSSLHKFIEEANWTCRLMEEIVEVPVSMELSVKMLEQRQSENRAHELYQIARKHVFKAARPTSPIC